MRKFLEVNYLRITDILSELKSLIKLYFKYCLYKMNDPKKYEISILHLSEKSNK